MERHKGRSLLSVRLLVGKWSGADPESLEFALRILAGESPWPKSAVEIRSEPLGLVCRKCARRFEPEELNLACPHCQSLDVEAVKGKDVYVESLEIE
jgi:hydrogenase nickel incorporation protein HypA/HybF